ncbi:conserved hypothetical protein [Verticillium alfalfae VaMs.102]|uniref:Uncharacterized protein n=1 Tax=Verticillium alfalfae (strain VaMs.102 / ATCC MYA-4576 / FGSC 10136) TaxID=526221 RepID=C9SWW9_VERA1|nr:conserved hypothetical protein [Verticillium alfalfae VaMs.102]EEY23510.1 conserved hypothetical protein [Verticillium alfalfae VaMs.102]
MANPQRQASAAASRYFTSSTMSDLQRIEDLYNRLSAVAQDDYAIKEREIKAECENQQLAFLYRQDVPPDVKGMLRYLLLENQDLHLDKLQLAYETRKKDILEGKRREERDLLTRMGTMYSESKPVPVRTPVASPRMSEVSPVVSPLANSKPSPVPSSTPLPSNLTEQGPPRNASQPPVSFRPSPLNPAAGSSTSVGGPPHPSGNNSPLQQPDASRAGTPRILSAKPTPRASPVQHQLQQTANDYLQARAASPQSAPTEPQGKTSAKPQDETPAQAQGGIQAEAQAAIQAQMQAFIPNQRRIQKTQSWPRPVNPSPNPNYGLDPSLFQQKKRKSEVADTGTVSEREQSDERIKRLRKSDVPKCIPDINISVERRICFEDVHQGGTPKYMHTIIKWEDGNYYILYCEEHGVHFRQRALTAAAKHLDSIAHGKMSRHHSQALEQLGRRIVDCDDEKMRRHNAVVAKAFENGYSLPSNESLLQENQTASVTDSITAETTVEVDSHQAHTPQLSQQIPVEPEANATHKVSHFHKVDKRKSPNREIIVNPVAGKLYYATPKRRFLDRVKKYIVMILAWKDLTVCGLPGTTLSQLELIQQAQRKNCYAYDAQGIAGWMPDFEDGGKHVKKRWFPVIWFEGTRTEDNREGWVRAEELSNFNIFPVPKRNANHPQIRAREWYFRCHPDEAPDGLGPFSNGRLGAEILGATRASTVASAVERPNNDQGIVEIDDTDSDSESAVEEAPERRSRPPVEDHASDSDYHASDDRDMAESVASSQSSRHPKPTPRRSTQELRSKATESEALRPVTPVRVGAAAGTRSSTKRQSVGHDIDMKDASPVLSPLSRRARKSTQEEESDTRAAAVTPQAPQDQPSIQLGTPLDKKASQEPPQESIREEPTPADGVVGTNLQDVVDQARQRLVDQACFRVATEAIQEVLGQKPAVSAAAIDASDKNGANTVGNGPGQGTAQQPPQDGNEDRVSVVSVIGAEDNEPSGARSITPTPLPHQAVRNSSAVPFAERTVSDEATTLAQESHEERAPSDAENGDGDVTSTHAAKANNTPASCPQRKSMEDRTRRLRPHQYRRRCQQHLRQQRLFQKDSRRQLRPLKTAEQNRLERQRLEPPTNKTESANHPSSKAGTDSLARFRTSAAAAPPPVPCSPAARAEPGVSDTVWHVSAFQQGNRRWSHPSLSLSLAVDEAGVARTSDADEMDVAINPRAVQSMQYSQTADKSRAEVILKPKEGMLEQKMIFTVGSGRNKMQSVKFVRWMLKVNPAITMLTGLTLPPP